MDTMPENMRVYRPRQVVLAPKKSRRKPSPFLILSPGQGKGLGLVVAAAVVMGLGVTHHLYGQVVELQGRVLRLQTSRTALADENNRLEAVGAQVTSKNQVMALAQRKLQLFEPMQGQVHRM